VKSREIVRFIETAQHAEDSGTLSAPEHSKENGRKNAWNE
jgi:hypothetical protein